MEWFEAFFGEDYLRFDRHEGTEREVAFIVQAMDLPAPARVLDLCCGYGRHAIALARRGYRVIGYDLSPVLLEQARQDAAAAGVEATWMKGDMRELPFGDAFEGVVNMFTSFGYFDDEAQNFDVLKRVGKALLPGGRFLIETVNRDFLVRHFAPVEWFRLEDLVVLERRRFDPLTNRSEVEVTVIDSEGERDYLHTIRVYAFTELQMLLGAAGLQVRAVWGDFDGSEYTWNARRMIVLAQKA